MCECGIVSSQHDRCGQSTVCDAWGVPIVYDAAISDVSKVWVVVRAERVWGVGMRVYVCKRNILSGV